MTLQIRNTIAEGTHLNIFVTLAQAYNVKAVVKNSPKRDVRYFCYEGIGDILLYVEVPKRIAVDDAGNPTTAITSFETNLGNAGILLLETPPWRVGADNIDYVF